MATSLKTITNRDLKQKTKEIERSKKALMNILEDVEEARQRAVRERDKTLAIVTNFADGLMVVDKDGIITMVNPQLEEAFKIEEKKIRGKDIRKLKSPPLLASAISLVLEKGKIKKAEREEFAFSKEETIEITTVLLKEEEKTEGHLLIFHDITREKIVEKLKTEFVSIAAHQLRTPLSAIKWTLKMLLDGDLGKVTKEQREFLDKTYQSNERMIILINDLLNITRIEEGRYLYRLSLINFEELVQSIADSFKEQTRGKRIRLEIKKPKRRLPKVKVDVEKMRLVLQNLIENAVRYTPFQGKITISCRAGKKEIEFSVKDTGIGIPKSQHKRVFDKFFRGSNVLKISTDGTGLGLFISKNIIEAHGGKIWFKSEENKGTTLFFTLPIEKG